MPGKNYRKVDALVKNTPQYRIFYDIYDAGYADGEDWAKKKYDKKDCKRCEFYESQFMPCNACTDGSEFKERPEFDEGFFEYLLNHLNPNEVEQYLSAYRSKSNLPVNSQVMFYPQVDGITPSVVNFDKKEGDC